MAATLDIASDPSNRRTMRAVGFVLDDLAHTAHPAYHGCYGLVLYRASGGFCRRDSGTADYRTNGAALLMFLHRCLL